MKYYITKAGEMVGPIGMEKPEYEDITSILAVERNANRKKEWQQHLASLPRVKHRLPNKVGDIVEEGKDFEWRHFCEACTSLGGGIRHCAHPEECGQVIRAAFPKEEKPVEESFTPEDILEKHGLINGFAVEAFTERVVSAMEEYAKQFKSPESFTREDMIGFAEWAEENYIKAPYAKWRKGPNVRSTDNMTSDELLTKYLTNKSRNNGKRP